MATIAFTNPPHPGIYPVGLATNAAARTQAREETEHKECLAQCEIFKGVKQALKDIILKVVEHDYLMEIEDKMLSFLKQMPRQMINHLKARGGALDFANTKTLLAERDAEWDISKNPQNYFNRTKQAIRSLARAGITSDLNEQRDMTLYYFKASGEFDVVVREWENKPAVEKCGQTSKHSSQQNTHARTNKTNLLQNNSEPMG
jgi:hypothetical protein